MKVSILNHSRIITHTSSDPSDIISEAQRAFPKDFPSTTCKWRLQETEHPYHFTLTPDHNPGGYNCDRCDIPIYDDIRFSHLEEDYCPDCCDEEEKKSFLKLPAYPFIAPEFEEEFTSSSSEKYLPAEEKETEKTIARLQRLFYHLAKYANVKSFTMVKDPTDVFALKKIKPMLSDEKKTMRLIQETMQMFSKWKSEAFSVFRKKMHELEELEELEKLENHRANKKLKHGGS
jgi:hypothetical protein